MTRNDATTRTVMVTGATRGIGADVARAFARTGARLVLTGRDVGALHRMSEEVRDLGGSVGFSGAFDLAERQQVFALESAVREAVDGVDVLVNNAGIGSRVDLRSVVDFDPAFWDVTMALNVTAPFLLCRALVPGMIRDGFGRIVNMASINGRVPSPNASAYVTSKHALIGFTRALALEVAGHGITVNAICPGPVDVGDDRRIAFDAERSGRTIEELEAVLTPMGGRLEPEEIAPLAVFLASAGAASLTGQAIHVDRGLVMR